MHRDLKPSNILIDGRGEPFVNDFGLAIHEDLQPLWGAKSPARPRFMAPEQVRGETHRLDGRTDVWALGVILYLGLCGRLPFPSKSRESSSTRSSIATPGRRVRSTTRFLASSSGSA